MLSANLNFIDPPTQVSRLHEKFVEKLTRWFTDNGVILSTSPDAPSVVTVVNGSRVAADIKRDLRRVQGM